MLQLTWATKGSCTLPSGPLDPKMGGLAQKFLGCKKKKRCIFSRPVFDLGGCSEVDHQKTLFLDYRLKFHRTKCRKNRTTRRVSKRARNNASIFSNHTVP